MKAAQASLPEPAARPSTRTITDKNAHEFPPLVREAHHLLKDKPESFFLTPKYYKGQRTLIRAELCELLETHPDLSPGAVVARIIGDLPDFIPADKIIELTRFTLRTWQALQAEGAAV